MKNEKWKWIKGYKGLYKISNLGRVKRTAKIKYKKRIGFRDGTHGFSKVVLKPGLIIGTVISSGYFSVRLNTGGGSPPFLVHRLVLETFVGPCPLGMQCRHLNDRKLDNRLDNLCWGTPKENTEDKVRNGRITRGEQVHNSKLTEGQVRQIKFLFSVGDISQRELADKFNVRPGTIQSILCGDNWRHVVI